MSMKLFYVPHEKKTGKPICIIDKSELLETTKGVTKAWRNHDFMGSISGIGDIVMEWVSDNKSKYGKSCVLTIDNYKPCQIEQTDNEIRNWFCKGNFKRQGLEDTPIVVSDGLGGNRENKNRVEYQNVKFSIALNNSISSEKQSGATTILRVFQ